MAGDVLVTIPDTQESCVIRGGHNGMLFAHDTAEISPVGHITSTFEKEIVAIQLPTLSGDAPEHQVLHEGGCLENEMISWSDDR